MCGQILIDVTDVILCANFKSQIRGKKLFNDLSQKRKAWLNINYLQKREI